jgi:hypothetical protein
MCVDRAEPALPNEPFIVTSSRCSSARRRSTAAREREVEAKHRALAPLSVQVGSCFETLEEVSIEPEYVQSLVLQATTRR